MKDRKIKNKKEIEKLFIKPIILSKDDTNKFEKHEMKKIRPIIRKWFYRLTNKNVLGKKPIIRDKLRNKLIRDIWKLLDAEKKKKKEKRSKMKKKRGIIKKQNKKIIKYNITRDIKILFEPEKEEDYYEPKRVSNLE